ncbi:MAG: ComEA family DNA-binding protein [Candidatus Acidiferrales bacterium]
MLASLFAGLLLHAEQKESRKRLELNTATAEELDTLPEVGPKLAKAIVQFREKSGPFRRVEDLLAVPGISKRRLEKIRPHVFVETKN